MKCRICNKKIKDNTDHEVRLTTSEGILIMKICTSCANKLDNKVEEEIVDA